jgi:hypothetical protein
MNGVPLQLHPVGQSLAKLQRCVQAPLTQWPPEQLDKQGPPTSG